jgi:hypothetical protein
MPTLKEVARDFGLGLLTLEDLREAAQAERIHKQTAEEVLQLISEWETRGWSRNELRSRVRRLVPPPPKKSRYSGDALYQPGLDAQRRRRV